MLWSECEYLACLIFVDLWDDMVFLLLSYLLFFLIMSKSNLTLFHFAVKHLRTISLVLIWTYDLSHLLWMPIDNPWNGAAFNGSFGLFVLTLLSLLSPYATSLLLSPFLGPWSFFTLILGNWFRWQRPSFSLPSSLGSVNGFIQSPPFGVVTVEIPFTIRLGPCICELAWLNFVEKS